jgi:non-specific serine/threonine protein kinase/serine/threonine-protein kinase
MDSAQVIARFEQERQALALMDHPNIAKVLDAGTTQHGRPYFVMELVKGIPITKFCDQEHLTPRERLELFVPVCQAVQHAHHKGVIHRDLKPSNVLIALYDGKPVPKVIDFGVAKAISQKLTERTMFTEVGSIVGTLEYMAPEQAELNNLDIDTRADVYSLGVLLYELLTGSPPFTGKQLRSAGFAEMMRLIREVEPPRPSTKLSSSAELPSIAANRKLEPKRLTRLMHGDLDWIAMKCLEKDRGRRYETPNGLALDVQRYLADEPVLAGPPSAGYRLRKFVQRNKGPVLAAAVVLLALLGGIAGTTWGLVQANRAWAAEAVQRQAADRHRDEADEQRRQAETEAAVARAVNDFLNKDLLAQAGPAQQSDRDLKLRTILDRASGKIAGRFSDQPLVEAAIRQTLGNAYDELGEYASAQTHLERGLNLYRRERGDEYPATLTAMVSLAYVLLDRGQYDQAKPLFDQALAVRRRRLGEEHSDTLAVLEKIGQWHYYQGQFSLAEPIQAQVLETSRRVLGEEHPDTVEAYHRLGMTNMSLRRFAQAEQLLVQARQLAERTLGPDHWQAIRASAMLGETYKRWDKLDLAEPLLTKGVQDAERVLGAHHRDTCYALMNLAGLYTRQNKHKEAEEVLVKALDGIVRSIGYEHDQTQIVVRMLVDTYLRQQKFDRAEQVLVLQRRLL